MANLANIINLSNMSKWDVPVTIHRTDALPLDNSSYFTSIENAKAYASSDNNTSFVGQVLNVLCLDLSTVTQYQIQDISGALRKIAYEDDLQNLSVENLCSDINYVSSVISSKIYVNDLVDSKSYSNLSVIKMSKDDFDEYIALSSDRMSSNTLYVVDSDYIDAYGQAISNVVMSSNNIPVEATIASEAANKNYVDYVEDKLSNEISTVRKVFKDLYSKIDSITLTSDLSDIIGAVVEVKDAIKNLTAY